MRQIFRYISNGKVILLNSDNMNWVRMPLEVYEGESKDKDKFYRKLIETFDFNSRAGGDLFIYRDGMILLVLVDV